MKITNSSSRLSYISCSGKVFIQINGKIPAWQTGFSSIKCAKIFASVHKVLDTDDMPYNADDFEWIVDTYGFEFDEDNMWVRQHGELTYVLQPQEYELVLNIFGEKVSDVYVGVDSILEKLDEDFPDILASVQLRSRYERNIFAASIRDTTKNMVRVKSSNLWSYSIDIKDRKSKFGDVYVQFKGKNGGPGDVYCYYDVPVALWRKWLTYPSKGAFHWKYIRNNYRYRKLTGDKRTHLPNGIN